MIGVQMGAEHDVDVFRSGAGRAQAREIRRVALMEARQAGALLVVAAAAVEQDRVPIGADEPGVHAGDEPVVLGRTVMRDKPRQVLLEHRALEAREILLRREARKSDLLLHACDAHRADGPGRHRRRLLFEGRHTRTCDAGRIPISYGSGASGGNVDSPRGTLDSLRPCSPPRARCRAHHPGEWLRASTTSSKGKVPSSSSSTARSIRARILGKSDPRIRARSPLLRLQPARAQAKTGPTKSRLLLVNQTRDLAQLIEHFGNGAAGDHRVRRSEQCHCRQLCHPDIPIALCGCGAGRLERDATRRCKV